MTEIEEGDLKFTFPDHSKADKYDEWSFYRNRFRFIAGGSKAVDIVCVSGDTGWLIEIKDYRRHRRTKLIDIDDELASKVRDTLAGLAAASSNADVHDERTFATQALRTRRWRVAHHLEQPNVRSRLRPQPFDIADVLSKMRKNKKLKAVDAHPVILNREANRPDVPWTAQ